MDFFYGIVPSYYVMCKDIINTVTFTTQSNPVKEMFIVILTVFALLSTFIIWFPNYVIYKLISLLMYLRHGNEFGGILEGIDSIYHDWEPKFTMNVVYIISHNGKNGNHYDKIRKACENLHNSHFKFSSEIRRFLSYYYYLKNKVTADETFKIFQYSNDELLSKESFLNYLQDEYYVKSSDRRLWEAKLCSQPILWNKKSTQNKHYALIIRTNHALADAISLLIYHNKYLGNDEEIQLPESTKKTSKEIEESCQNCNIYKAVFQKEEIWSEHLTCGTDHYFAFSNEENPKLLRNIKKLRKDFHTTVTDVLAAAGRDAISKYYKKENINIDKMSLIMPCRRAFEDIEALLNGKIFANDSSAIEILLPIHKKCDHKENCLKEVNYLCGRVKHSVDRQLVYIWNKLITYFPHFLRVWIYHSIDHYSLAITNVPLPDVKDIASCPIVDIFGFVNHFGNAKFILSVLTFRERMHLVLTSKKGIVKSKNEAEQILEDIVKYIEGFEMEPNQKKLIINGN